MIRLQFADVSAEILPTQGASLGRLRKGAKDYVRVTPENPDFVLDTAGFLMFPYCNRIKNGRFSFDGRDIVLPSNFRGSPHTLHGHSWILPWDVIAHSEASATMRFAHSADSWPWAYEAFATYTLSETGLLVEGEIKNLSDTAMPCGTGFHPYFNRKANTRAAFETTGVWESNSEVLPTNHVAHTFPKDASGLIDPASVGPWWDNCYTGFGREFGLYEDGQKILTMTASDNCKSLHLYVPEGEAFFCAEPVTHDPDSFNRDRDGFTVLEPNQSLKVWVRIEI